MQKKFYPYRLQAKRAFTIITGFFAITILACYTAYSMNESISIFGLIQLDSTQSKSLFIALAIVIFLTSLLNIFLAFISLSSDRQIEIDADKISAPEHLLKKEHVTIPHRAIQRLNLTTYKNYRVLLLRHADGCLSIPDYALPSKALFEDLHSQLSVHINNQRLKRQA